MLGGKTMPLVEFSSEHLLRAALCALALAASAGAEPPQARPTRPAAGVFLVAKPQIEEGAFWHSVVLILAHGEDGTLGLVINRVTDITLAKALPDLKSEDAESYSLQFGGPVGLDGLLYLFSAEDSPPEAKKVMANVCFSGDKALLEDLLKNKDSKNHLKLYLGHAGWLPGQLEMEIARGDWDLVPADAFTVFQREPQTIWPTLTKRGTVVARAPVPDRL